MQIELADVLDTKDTSMRAIMLRQLSKLKPSVFISLSVDRDKQEKQKPMWRVKNDMESH